MEDLEGWELVRGEAKRALEIENVLRQYDRVGELARANLATPDRCPLSLEVLLELHGIAAAGIYTDAGALRDVNVRVGAFKPPEWRYVGGLLDHMFDQLAEWWDDDDVDECLLAAYVMWRVNWIHPFRDGNGRTSRAAAYLVLLAFLRRPELPGSDHLTALVADAHREDYILALKEADAAAEQGTLDVSVLAGLLDELLEAQLREGLESASGNEDED